MLTWLKWGILIWFIGVWAQGARSATEATSAILSERVITAQRINGQPVWRAHLLASGLPFTLQASEGWVQVGDYLLDAQGQVQARAGETAPGQPALDPAAWDALTALVDSEHSFSGPQWDSQENAWVLLQDVNTQALRITHSLGDTGLWARLVTLLPGGVTDTFQPTFVVDHQDHIQLVYRAIVNSHYQVHGFRFDPVAGWQGPTTLYSTPNFFQALRLAVDSSNNITLIIDEEATASFVPEIWSLVYEAQTGVWRAPQRISPAGRSAHLPTLAYNAAGDTVYLIYLHVGGFRPGLYAHPFKLDTLTWGPRIRLPGSNVAGAGLAGPASKLPAVVDAAGNVTLFWSAYLWAGAYSTVYASRLSQGFWNLPHRFFPWSTHWADLENFASATVNPAGDVLSALTRTETNPLSNELYVLRYRLASGWSVENPYHYSSALSSTRVRSAWWGDAGGAVVTFHGPGPGGSELQSLVHNGLTWETTLTDIPGQDVAFFHESATYSSGAVLLIYDNSFSGAEMPGVYASWLR